MTLHKEGTRTIVFVLLLIVVFTAALNVFFPQQSIWHLLFYFAEAVLLVVILRFFRFPQKNMPMDDKAVFSGADGKVVAIEEVDEDEYIKGKCIQVSVFMSVNNVHINWFPVNGIIEYYKYHPGKYLVAWHPKSSTLNERTSVAIRTKENALILVRQIAGFVARRVVCYAKEGEAARQGKQLGFIKFGSRVDHFLPLNADIKVELNQIVKGGQSILARL